jgi:hypothetical protein
MARVALTFRRKAKLQRDRSTDIVRDLTIRSSPENESEVESSHSGGSHISKEHVRPRIVAAARTESAMSPGVVDYGEAESTMGITRKV